MFFVAFNIANLFIGGIDNETHSHVACCGVWNSLPYPGNAQAKKPNILVIWGDDIGTWNISHNSRGMMGYKTPNIDRIAKEGVAFTDYYAQQSCTAGRAAFISGSVPVRSGMTKVGMPGAKEGWQKTDVTMATVLKSQGYATGQFGKNHQGDRDEHLPTMHGFDEFLGSLYHLNAEEEPENRDYPSDMKLPNGKTFREQFGPRGVLKCKADGKGGQTIENLGPLTKKRMETIDDETLAAAKDFITRQAKAGKPFFCWWNGTRMHFRTHVKPEHKDLAGPNDEYTDGMVEHDMHVGELLKLIDDLGLADNTIVQYSTDNGPHYNTWPDAGTTPFRGEKNSNWEGAFRVPCFVRWPGHFPAGVTLNGIVVARGLAADVRRRRRRADIKEKLLKGACELNGRTYKNHIDGYNLLDYLSGKAKDSPRKEFIYVNDDGDVVVHPRGRLEGDLPGEPRASTARVARAVRPPAPAAALQPAARSVREVPAQLEHLPRLDDRPGVRARCRCRRSPASSS